MIIKTHGENMYKNVPYKNSCVDVLFIIAKLKKKKVISKCYGRINIFFIVS